jgi:hypothetical protein
VPALSFKNIEQSGYLTYESNQYIEKWCEMENMKFMEIDEDNGSKIRGFGYTIITISEIEDTGSKTTVADPDQHGSV